MKKPFYYALGAAIYIVLIVLVINIGGSILGQVKDNIAMPMAMLGLFVLSASVMGFLFLSEPLRLFLVGQKKEAFVFFGKIVGIFACFVIIFAILIFLI